MGAVKILCAGDLHLGRRPSRIGADDRELGVDAVWEKIVEAALELRVDLVALTGDVVDRENRYYEALGPLERGLRRLKAAGIEVFAVAGNHDFDVLPRVQEAVGAESFRLMGRGGEWETAIFERQGQAVLRLVGWSFPEQHVKRSPLFELPEIEGDLPTVGLLHADLDQAASRYAPVSRVELERRGLRAWLLGHIHRPAVYHSSSGGQILYPGSPQPLHPGEGGAHGPWLVEIGAGRAVESRQLLLSTLRYRELSVDLGGVEEEEEFHRVVPEKIREDLKALHGEAPKLRHVVYRVRFEGRTGLHRKVGSLAGRVQAELDASFEGLKGSVDAVRVETTPTVDLQALARSNDPPGVLAKLILEMQEGRVSTSRKVLVDGFRKNLEAIHRANAYAPLRVARQTEGFIDEEQTRRMVVEGGLSLLDEMLAQKRREVGS